jgi:ribose transport system substrate-binding protein
MRKGAIAVITLAGLVVAGCSSSKKDSAGSNASGNIGQANGCVQEATAIVDAARATIKPTYPTGKIDSSKNRGKTIWFISSTQQVQVLLNISKGVQAAGSAAGLQVKVYDGAGSPAKYNDGLTQAVDQRADGIILQGIDPALVTSPLAKATAAKIATIDSMNGDPSDRLQNGISSHVTVDFTKSGKLQADYILAKTKCDAKILELTSSLFVAVKDRHKGFADEIHRLCSGCKITTKEVDFQNISSSVSSLVRAGIQRDPNINYVMANDDSMGFFVPPTLQSLGSKVPVVSGNGVAETLAYITKKQNLTMDVSFAPAAYIGWKQVDLLQRAMLGVAVPSGELPQQLIDEGNLAADSSQQFPGFSDYEATYRNLWSAS